MFGELTRQHRQRLNLTQEELAERAGMSVRAIGKIENDKIKIPRPQTLRLLAEALELTGNSRDRFMQSALPAAGSPAPGSPFTAPDEPSIPAQLPRDVSGFVGRDAEIATLDMLVADTGRRVVVVAIDGMAGVGKTALAVRWAHLVRDRFPDGQLYVDLRGYSTDVPVTLMAGLVRVLHAFGVPTDRLPADIDSIGDTYRSVLADKRVLILLDNALDAGQVRLMLPTGAGSAAIVTSRSQLRGLIARDGACRLPLKTLSRHDATALLTSFLDRGEHHVEHDMTAELARQCGYLPLALRIAAANLITKPHETIADHLDRMRAGNRLRTLSMLGDPSTAVSASLALSYQSLPDKPQRLFRLLGLAPGPDFTVEVACALAASDSMTTEHMLDELVNAHLVEVRPPGRYALHDLVQEYAATIANHEETSAGRDTPRNRMLQHYLDRANMAAAALYPAHARLRVPGINEKIASALPFDQVAALNWLDAELPCLVNIASHAGATGSPVAWLIADALRGYFWLRRPISEWQTISRSALTAARSAAEPAAEAAAWLCTADAEHARGNYAQALAAYQQAQTCEQPETSEIRFAALNNLGNLHLRTGSPQEAAACYERVLEFDRRCGSTLGEAMRLGNLGAVYRTTGDLARSADLHAQAVAVHRAADNWKVAAQQMRELGEVSHLLGRLDQAECLLNEALSRQEQIGDLAGQAETWISLAALRRDRGEQELAPIHNALTMAKDLSDSHIEAIALNCLATIHSNRGEHHQSHDHHTQALRKAESVDSCFPQVEALLGLSAAHHSLGNRDKARSVLAKASSIATKSGFRILHARALLTLAELHYSGDNVPKTLQAGQQALDIFQKTGHRIGVAYAHLILGSAHRSIGNLWLSEEHLQDARTLGVHRSRVRVDQRVCLVLSAAVVRGHRPDCASPVHRVDQSRCVAPAASRGARRTGRSRPDRLVFVRSWTVRL